MTPKKRVLLTILLLGIGVISSCTPDWAGQPQVIIEGREPVIRHALTPDAFHSVRLNEVLIAGSTPAPIRVTLEPADTAAVELTTNTDLVSHFTCEVKNGWLEFSAKDPGSYQYDDMSLTIRYPRGQLKEVRALGTYTITAQDPVETHTLNLFKQGKGVMNLHVAVSNMDVYCGDDAQIVLAGTATDVSIRTAGTAQVEASALLVDTASVNIRGAGNCSIYATKKLNIQVVGAGTVEYAGEPEIWKVMFGPANVRQAGN